VVVEISFDKDTGHVVTLLCQIITKMRLQIVKITCLQENHLVFVLLRSPLLSPFFPL